MGSAHHPLLGPLNQHMSSRAIIVAPACIITTAGIIECSLYPECCHLLPPGPRPWLHWKELQEGTVGHAVLAGLPKPILEAYNTEFLRGKKKSFSMVLEGL